MIEYAERNKTTAPVGIRVPRHMNAALDALSLVTGITKSVIIRNLFHSYLTGRIGTQQVDLPLPPPALMESYMAAAKKTVSTKAKAVKPAAKAKTTKKK